MKKLLLFIVLCVLVLGEMVGFMYNTYVNNTDSPYDEIGITLNGIMPASIQSWGCAKLKVNFEGAVPPLHCGKDDDPTAWAD